MHGHWMEISHIYECHRSLSWVILVDIYSYVRYSRKEISLG